MRFSTAVLLVIFIFSLIMLVKAVCIVASRSESLRPIAMFIFNIFDIPYTGINMFNNYIRSKAGGYFNYTLRGTVSNAYGDLRSRASSAYSGIRSRINRATA